MRSGAKVAIVVLVHVLVMLPVCGFNNILTMCNSVHYITKGQLCLLSRNLSENANEMFDLIRILPALSEKMSLKWTGKHNIPS